ncbi:hypothetical protein HYT57_04005 [Candidatus Woesearchaeota archaeon]|nr:hypothetical protein [Candidatus Woesearchaeota archaeon]
MDTLAHFLWTFALFFKRKERWLAGLFGVLPDLVSFGPHLILSFIAGNAMFGRSELTNIPVSVFMLYNLTHSIIIFVLAVLIVYLLTKKIHWFMFGWGLHILIDIPSHTTDFFPTPFLYPFPQFYVNGIQWNNPVFMIVNYSLLVIVYAWLMYGLVINRKLSKES